MASRVSSSLASSSLLRHMRPASAIGGLAHALSLSPSHTGRRGSKNLDWYFNALKRREELSAVTAPVAYPVDPLHGRKRARVFLDVGFGTESSSAAGRMVLELADDIVPLACRQFVTMCERSAGGYRGREFFHVRKGHVALAGDVVGRGIRGGHSAFGTRTFVDENFIVRHAVPGVLTLPNAGVHSNTSIFGITLAAAPHLDGKHVAFGRVLTGFDVLNRIGTAFTVNLRPATPIIIRDAGMLPESQWAAVDKQVAAEAKSAAAKAKTVPPPKAAAAGAAKAAPQ